MSKSNLFFICFLLGVLFPIISNSQVNDAGLWASIDLEKKLSKKITAKFNEEFRFNENITELGTVQSEIGLEYRFNKLIALSGSYRFSNRRRVDDSYSNRHRFITNINLRNKFGKINLAFRLRYQSQYSNIQSSENGTVPKNYLRTKLTAKYDLGRKYRPYISGETFYYMNNPDGILYDNYRIAAGIEYEFNKKSGIDLGYMIDREVNVNNPWTSYIVVISWSYKL